MKTKSWAIALVVFTTLINTAAQFLYKVGANKLEPNLLAIITNYHLIFGVILYFISASLLIIALRGGELSVLYPIIALSYLWVIIVSGTILHEEITLLKWAGAIVIVLGVSFVGIGGRK
jgi:drug/metabolite transporter (DMT)-like permease